VLREIINILQRTETSLSLDDLSKRLGVGKGALNGMLETLIHMGKIEADSNTQDVDSPMCKGRTCRGCAAAKGCPFAGKMPQTYSLVDFDK
jgi:predicted ArsR family transcriptional regulator